MTTNHPDAPDSDAVATLLSHAEPRPVPPSHVEEEIRSSVHAEWQSIVQQRKRGALRRQLAIAASLLVAVSAGLFLLNQPPTVGVTVANVDKQIGNVTLSTDDSENRQLSGASTFSTGDVVETRRNAALGLSWHRGGSLRLDADTRLEFVDEQTVYLHSGRVYFDSEDEVAPFDFVVQTSHGSLTHVGTRYMAAADNEELIVTVREGRVRIDGRGRDTTAGTGKRVEIRGSGSPVALNASGYGDAWVWVEAVSPSISKENRSVHDFLSWVTRETGYQLIYDDRAVEALASTTVLSGRVQADPRTELRLTMLTTDMDYELDSQSGVIRVRGKPSAGR